MTRTPEEIRAEIDAARTRLTENVEGLVSQVHPEVLKDEIADKVKAAVREKVDTVKSAVVDAAGIRWDRVGTAVLVTAGVVVSLLVFRGLGRTVKRIF